MKMFFEGTVDEIKELMEKMVQPDGFTPTGTNASGSSVSAKKTGPANPLKFVSIEFARRVLARRRLTANSRAVLFVLYRAPPREFVTYARIRDALGLTEWEFRGIQGGFGKRVSGTAGYEKEANFFEYDSGGVEEERKMRLPDSVRSALLEKFPELSGADYQLQS